MPIVEALAGCGKPLSIDTYKPEVMRAALAGGADLINDIWGFRMPGAVEAVAAGQAGLCVMHMQRDPQTMQEDPHYTDVVAEVASFWRAGVNPACGGRGRSAHFLIRALALARLRIIICGCSGNCPAGCDGLPILAGLSRKSTLGAIIGGKPPQARVAAGGAVRGRARRIYRARARREQTVDALKVWWASAMNQLPPNRE
jgi:dihydropteroate synthase